MPWVVVVVAFITLLAIIGSGHKPQQFAKTTQACDQISDQTTLTKDAAKILGWQFVRQCSIGETRRTQLSLDGIHWSDFSVDR